VERSLPASALEGNLRPTTCHAAPNVRESYAGRRQHHAGDQQDDGVPRELTSKRLVVVSQDLAIPFSELQFDSAEAEGRAANTSNRSETRVECCSMSEAPPA